MRLPVTSLCVLLAACQGGAETTAPGGDGTQVATVELHGLVYDSLTGVPLANAVLTLNGTIAQTDGEGFYRARVATGPLSVRVRLGLYEEYRIADLATSQRRLDFPLRRLAPALLACAIGQDSIRAVIADLGGRKTLNRAEGSTVLLATSGGETLITAWDMSWRAIDPYRWRAAVSTWGLAVDRAVWTLRDQKGFGDLVDCSTVPAPPAFPDPTEPGEPN
jgi:hypothetical protein